MQNRVIVALAAFLITSISYNIYQYEVEKGLRNEILLEKVNTDSLRLSIDKQNSLIEELRVTKKPVEIPKLEHIVVEDESCQAELRGYKKLFKEMSKCSSLYHSFCQ